MLADLTSDPDADDDPSHHRAGPSRSRWVTARTLLVARPWLTVVVVLVLVGGGVLAYRQFGATGSGTAAAPTTTRLVTVSTGTVRASVSTTGTIAPAVDKQVSFSSSATVTSVRVSTGQRVRNGQVLGTIATLSLRASLAQARATLATAQATLASAEDDDTTTSAQLTVDKLAVTAAERSVSSAKTAVADAVLRSPVTGTVASVNVATGDTSSGSGTSTSATMGSAAGTSSGTGGGSTGASGSGSSGGSGTGSGTGSANSTTGSSSSGTSSNASTSSGDFEIIATTSWTVSASVDDTEVGLIRKGDEVQLSTDNVSSAIFGVVTSVAVLSSDSSGSASYPVTIAVTGSPSGLHDGASATATITYKQVTNVLTVPTTAIHRDTSGSFVYVSTGGARTRTTVKTGLASGGTTQITAGLKSGQQVYVQSVTARHPSSGTSTQSNTGNGFPGGGNFPGGGANFPGGGNAPAGANAPGGGR